MVEFYYSEDKGLLDDRARNFQELYPSYKSIKNPSISDLNIFFLQVDLLNPDLFFIVEDFQCSLESIEELLASFDSSNYNILFLKKVDKDIYIPFKFRKLIENKEIKLPLLNIKTKRSYINEKLKCISLEKDLQKLVKDILPPNAEIINEFIEKLLLIDSSDINEDLIRQLALDPRNSPKFLNFFMLYLTKDDFTWMSYFHSWSLNSDALWICLRAFVYKMFEFKRFLELRRTSRSSVEVAEIMRTKKYFLRDFEILYKQFKSKIIFWLNRLIIDLYFLFSKLKFSGSVNLELFKFFLLKNKLSLMNL